MAQWGAWGVIVVGLAYAVVHLWKQLKEAQGRLDQEHKERLNDAKQNTTAMLELAERSTEAISQLHDLIEAVRSMLNRTR